MTKKGRQLFFRKKCTIGASVPLRM